jgi:hypothetical protein
MGEERERRGPEFELKKMNLTNGQTKGKKNKSCSTLINPTSHKKPIKGMENMKI